MKHYGKSSLCPLKKLQHANFIDELVRHLTVGKIKVSKVSDMEKTVPTVVNDVIVHAEPDSGADVNVMDERQYGALQRKTYKDITQKASNTKLSTLQIGLKVSGQFKATVRNQTRGTDMTFAVVKGKINSPPLLGKKALYELGMLEIRPDGSLKEQNELSIRHKNNVNSILDEHDKKKHDAFLVKFSMKTDAAPIEQKPRPVPYFLMEPLQKWLECIKEEIFVKIAPGEPVTWCSPLVVQLKQRYSAISKDNLEPHMIRASVDLLVQNKYMERNRILQAPVVEDFTCKFHDCKVFSKMDLKQGYHQLILHPDSRAVATFSTPWGNMRPKRLLFGAKSSHDHHMIYLMKQ